MDLMQKRYKVIAEDTSGHLKIGDMLILDDEANVFWYGNRGYEERELKRYPHLFRKLEWWEDINPEEMPKYLKETEDGFTCIYKHKEDFIYLYEQIKLVMDNDKRMVCLCYLLPATEAEYLEYQKTKQ